MEQSMYMNHLQAMETLLDTNKYSPEGWEFNYETQSGTWYFKHLDGAVIYVTLGFDMYEPSSGIPVAGFVDGEKEVMDDMISTFTMADLTGDVDKDCQSYINAIESKMEELIIMNSAFMRQKKQIQNTPLKQFTVRVEAFVTFTAPEGTDIKDVPMMLDVPNMDDDETSPVVSVHETEITVKEISSEVNV